MQITDSKNMSKCISGNVKTYPEIIAEVYEDRCCGFRIIRSKWNDFVNVSFCDIDIIIKGLKMGRKWLRKNYPKCVEYEETYTSNSKIDTFCIEHEDKTQTKFKLNGKHIGFGGCNERDKLREKLKKSFEEIYNEKLNLYFEGEVGYHCDK